MCRHGDRDDSTAVDTGEEVVHVTVGCPEMTRSYAKIWQSRWNPNDCDSLNPPPRNSRGAFPPAGGLVRQSMRSLGATWWPAF